MSTSTIRKAIGAVKDQTSISLAKVAGTIAPDLEVLVVKATTHDEDPADEKYIREIVGLTSHSRGYVTAAVATISKRLSKTRDWIVALKALMLVHRLLIDGHALFEEEIVRAARRGVRVLNMAEFRDEAHSNSWDHAGFVRCYGMYLDEKVEFEVAERKLRGVDNRFEEKESEFEYGMRRARSSESLERKEGKNSTPVREMRPERVLGRLNDLLRVLDRVLGCRPAGMAKTSRLVIVALYGVVKESFRLYVEICEALGVLLDRFGEMEYGDCVKAFDVYVNAAKMIDELLLFYNWCKDMGIARTSEYPEVLRITDKLLGTLEGYLKEKTNRPKSTPEREERVYVDEEVKQNVNEIKALPAPESFTPTPPPPAPVAQPKPASQPQRVTDELVNLRDDGVTVDEQGNKLALALFSGPPTTTTTNPNGSWEAFDSNGEPEVTSAWQTPAADSGKADWELALVETASNLSKQKADLAGGFDPLLLNGMYDQGTVRQHVSTSQLSGGSASSVAMPLPPGKGSTPVLALPAPDGTVQAVGQQDPFAASLTVPPPSYVQIADMERKQHLLTQEQLLWQQYGKDGMQGQVSLAKLSGGSGYYGPQPMMPYGMPQPGGYYYAPY
ncbi:putative ANTH domain-containing protein [Rosa chinensis]|uniref:Putative ANTH domain-containing protein n=1 Tax=Rosa chinensis TaxID=74649 RepID=A0A2P6RIR9_ROSCH|nr:probable clathrin assembly protein At4g32285 [Rosa chinensis]PRQ46326.1 putative ANTH domain-containing protein [Rosa chinensis]